MRKLKWRSFLEKVCSDRIYVDLGTAYSRNVKNCFLRREKMGFSFFNYLSKQNNVFPKRNCELFASRVALRRR
jgi:hypothetical protein